MPPAPRFRPCPGCHEPWEECVCPAHLDTMPSVRWTEALNACGCCWDDGGCHCPCHNRCTTDECGCIETVTVSQAAALLAMDTRHVVKFMNLGVLATINDSDLIAMDDLIDFADRRTRAKAAIAAVFQSDAATFHGVSTRAPEVG